MIEVIVDPAQLQELKDGLTRLEAAQLIRPNLEVFGKTVVEIAKVYPSESIGLFGGTAAAIFGTKGKKGRRYLAGRRRTYQRTGNYGANWQSSVKGLGPGFAEIENLAVYAGYVGGLESSPGGRIKRANQPYTWRHGWKRLKVVAEQAMDEWIKSMENLALRIWES